jgi:hypothetical protein
MIGTISAGCVTADMVMWAVTTVLRLTLIAVGMMQLKRD